MSVLALRQAQAKNEGYDRAAKPVRPSLSLGRRSASYALRSRICCCSSSSNDP